MSAGEEGQQKLSAPGLEQLGKLDLNPRQCLSQAAVEASLD